MMRTTAIGEATSAQERKRRAGQQLVIGLQGTAVSDDLRKLVAEIRPAGFVLFARNVAEPEQVVELNRELASLVDERAPALLAVDQEGGRVQRIRAPATEWPTMRDVGSDPATVTAFSEALALEVASLGFNLNFAPVADVHNEPDNPIIGDRAFASTAPEVGRAVAAFVEAHQRNGVIACAKHFPGHGATTVDSHLDLPIVDRPNDALEQVELPPFKAAVDAGVGTIMTSHVVYTAWDETWPATLSPTAIRGRLREDMAFDGVVFSDDLEMKALRGRWPLQQQIHRALDSSVDVFLVCSDAALQIDTFEALVRAQEGDGSRAHASRDAERRVHALRERFFLGRPVPPTWPDVLGCAAHRDLAARMSLRAGRS